MAQQKGKKVVVRRRRERKNIENRAMPFLGQALADWASAAPESLRRSLHREQQKLRQRQQWNTA